MEKQLSLFSSLKGKILTKIEKTSGRSIYFETSTGEKYELSSDSEGECIVSINNSILNKEIFNAYTIEYSNKALLEFHLGDSSNRKLFFTLWETSPFSRIQFCKLIEEKPVKPGITEIKHDKNFTLELQCKNDVPTSWGEVNSRLCRYFRVSIKDTFIKKAGNSMCECTSYIYWICPKCEGKNYFPISIEEWEEIMGS